MPKEEELIIPSARAFIGLGSNIEPRLDYLRAAMNALAELGVVVSVSGIYETAPVGGVPQNDFLNAVVELSTTLDPINLVQHLKAIESQIGRIERPRWHEREIDLDLIFYGDTIMRIPGLTIPHPELHNRAFVLVPMMEIVPNFVHPVFERTVSDLFNSVEALDVRKTESSL
jgi:2-amino-4-hydroxy-6-hydroxymethyldihydropteridine diphosphokinase